MARYETQREKIKKYLEWTFEQLSDGEWRNLNKFLAKISVEKGFKKETVLEMLKDYEILGMIELNYSEKDTPAIRSLVNFKDNGIDKDAESILKDIKKWKKDLKKKEEGK